MWIKKEGILIWEQTFGPLTWIASDRHEWATMQDVVEENKEKRNDT